MPEFKPHCKQCGSELVFKYGDWTCKECGEVYGFCEDCGKMMDPGDFEWTPSGRAVCSSCARFCEGDDD